MKSSINYGVGEFPCVAASVERRVRWDFVSGWLMVIAINIALWGVMAWLIM